MKNKLSISREANGGLVVLFLDGRIDAYWASALNDAVNTEIRSGNYRLFLDFSSVDFLSSAGIRILIKSYKDLKKINGEFKLVNIADDIRKILEMVGLKMLIGEPEPLQPVDKKTDHGETKFENTSFKIEELPDGKPLEMKLYGHPEIMFADKDAGDVHSIKLDEPLYGLGLGAISPNAEDALERMGEFIALGEAIAYLPTDASNAPDYSIKTGRLIPEVQCLYGLFFNDAFNNMIHFEHHDIQQTVSMSGLVEGIFEVSGLKTFVMVMIAETSGLVGVSLSSSPGKNPNAQLFQFPEVRDRVHFTIEPEHARQLAVVTGIFTKAPDQKLAEFCRPLAKGAEINGHAHAAVFGFHPLKKSDVKLDDLIRDCFENERLINIMHLLNDDRETIGIGESHFLNGMCWVGAF